MAGIIWRQHRFVLAGVPGLLGALALGLWRVGSSLHHAYAAAIACHPASSLACQDLASTFNGMDGFLANGIILQAVPVLIGAFAGAPLLARELETGTYRYAWTQGFGRSRWALAKLVALALAVAVPAGLFSLLLSWYYQPYFAPGHQALGLTGLTPFFPGVFDLRGVFAAWTLAAFAIGAVAGMLIRRVVPAIAATLAVYAGLAFAAGGLLREHYLAPLVTSSSLNVPNSAWILSQWWTKGGTTVSPHALNTAINNAFTALNPTVNGPGQKYTAYTSVLQYLTQHGYTYWTRYQPGSRYWPFQWIESGGLLALSVACIAVTVWLVRRRAA
jgi:ABC-type transport system involved in multi-copper enzyme maturation permease subunit